MRAGMKILVNFDAQIWWYTFSGGVADLDLDLQLQL